MNVAGKIGIGDGFDGSNGYFTGAGAFDPTNGTVSCWVYPTNAPAGAYFLAVKHHSGFGTLGIKMTATSWRFGVRITTNDGVSSFETSFEAGSHATLNRWYHLAATYDGTDVKAYVDGAVVNTVNEPGRIHYPPGNDNERIGGFARAGDTPDVPVGELQGRLDEIRFSYSGRSAAWVKASYSNQLDASAFMSFAGEEVGAGGTPATGSSWPDSMNAWRRRQRLDINRCQAGGNVTNFPVVVTETNLNASFWSWVQNDGDDIYFTEDDGVTPLSYEIEDFDTNNQKLAIWVKMPEVSAVSDTPFYVYYGNSSVGPQEDAANVWDSNYKLVLHLDESPNDTAYEHLDSSGNTNSGAPFNFTDGNGGTTDAEGITDGADFFQPEDDYVSVAYAASLDITNTITFGLWLRYDDVGTDLFRGLLSMSSTYIRKENGNYFRLIWGGGGDTRSTTIPANGVWYHVVGTYDGAYLRVYVNGVREDNDARTGPLTTLGGSSAVSIAPSFGGYRHDGLMDEVRISDTARSGAWIETSYNNQIDPASFFTTYEEEGPPAGTIILLR